MTETHADFLLYAGSTWQFDAALHDAEGNALDVTAAQIVWRLFRATGSKVMELTVGTGIEVINPTGGLCRITVPANQTAGISAGSYRDEIVVTMPDGFVCTQAVGNILVNKPGGVPIAAGDVSDPCATLAQLQNARLGILTGGRQARVKIENFEVEYSPANMNDLDAAIRQYETLCRAQTGKPPRRFAIGSGMRPQRY